MIQHSTLCSLHLSETIVEKEPEEEAESTSPTTVNVPYLKRNTPILFSTNRGLHLRITTGKSLETQTLTSTSMAARPSVINSTYNIVFCDLERWSTNRAHTINLENTFTIPKPSVVTAVAPDSLASTNLRILPQKSTLMRFSGYSRFDVE